jgi:flagellar motor component MotA
VYNVAKVHISKNYFKPKLKREIVMTNEQTEALRIIGETIGSGGIRQNLFAIDDSIEVLLRHFGAKYIECLPLYNPERTDEVAADIITKSEFARANGTLALEPLIAEISAADYPCAVTGLKLVMEGSAQSLTFSVLLTILTRLSHTAPRQLFFDNLLWTVGTLCIQHGENPRLVRERLSAFLDPEKTPK